MEQFSTSVADAIAHALHSKENCNPLPSVSANLPHCTIDDIQRISDVIKQFNGSPIASSALYVSIGTSQATIDLAEDHPTLRPNPATQIRIVCNVEMPSKELREFKPGYYHGVMDALRNHTPLIQAYPKGVIIPLSFNQTYFGVAIIDSSKPKTQQNIPFGIIFQVIVDPPIEDLDGILFRLLATETARV